MRVVLVILAVMAASKAEAQSAVTCELVRYMVKHYGIELSKQYAERYLTRRQIIKAKRCLWASGRKS
jgi:hypothetical protein